MTYLSRNRDIMEVRMRTNWPIIYMDFLRVFFYRRQYNIYLRKMFRKKISKRLKLRFIKIIRIFSVRMA